jgi:hypothetical protein
MVDTNDTETREVGDVTLTDIWGLYKDYRAWIVLLVTAIIGALGGNVDRVDEWLPSNTGCPCDPCECVVEQDESDLNSDLDAIRKLLEEKNNDETQRVLD